MQYCEKEAGGTNLHSESVLIFEKKTKKTEVAGTEASSLTSSQSLREEDEEEKQ